MIRQNPDASGVSVSFIASSLGRSEFDVKQALENLASEGHVYSTVDEGKISFSDELLVFLILIV